MIARRLVLLVIVLAAAAAGAWYYIERLDAGLPDHVAVGNGRIEAEEVQVATKFPGRVADVLVEEGDMVKAGQVLARMDTTEAEASLARANADVAQAREQVVAVQAEIAQRESELRYAQEELRRALTLFEKGHIAKERVDQRQTARDSAQAGLNAARARLETAKRAVEAAQAEARRIQTQIDEATLTAPRDGRVQYRLAEPGEVLASGGRVITLLDLTDVYMTIFLPTSEVGRVYIGAEARIVLDAAPEYVIPAHVSFISADAQFTPKEVETRTEREKLMFRIKIKIPAELLREHIEKVRTGLPGVAYVMMAPETAWPEKLVIHLPPAAQ